MRVQPEIDEQGLRDALALDYGIGVQDLSYVPQGEVGYNYVVRAGGESAGHDRGPSDRRYILKLLDSSRLARAAAERMRVAMPLLCELRVRQLLPNVPEPVFTLARQPSGRFDGFAVFVLVYVEGRNPDASTLHRLDVWEQLAGHVAGLHRATDSLQTPCPYKETYALPFEQDLMAGLQALERVSAGARQGVRDLRRLLLPRSSDVVRLLGQTKDLASQTRYLAPPNVLCHTDIHAMNLLIDDRDKLTLLDWEGIKLAPAEHDLFAFCDHDFPDFLAAYWRAGGVRQLNAEAFSFYFYRRNLEDLTDWLVRILHENDDPLQDQADLAGMQSDCIDGWPYLEGATDRVRRQLARLSP